MDGPLITQATYSRCWQYADPIEPPSDDREVSRARCEFDGPAEEVFEADDEPRIAFGFDVLGEDHVRRDARGERPGRDLIALPASRRSASQQAPNYGRGPTE